MLGWSNFRDCNKSVYIVGLEQKKHEMSHEAIILLGYQAILIVGKISRLHNECDLLSFKYLFIDGIYLRSTTATTTEDEDSLTRCNPLQVSSGISRLSSPEQPLVAANK